MGALEDLAAALAGQQIQGQLSQHNAYADLAGLAGGIGNSAISLGSANPKRFKTGEVVGTSLASGVLQGLLGNLGESYQAGLTDQYQNVIKNTLLGQPVDSGSLTPSIFKTGQDTANIFRLQNAVGEEQAQAQFQNEISKAIALEGIKGDSATRLKLLEKYLDDPQKTQKALAALGLADAAEPIATPSGDPSLDTVQNLPKEFQNEALKELSAKNTAKERKAFADSQFEAAKQLGSLESLVPNSKASNEMEGIQNSLATFVQRYLGREMSQVERENFLKILPDWNDSVDKINLKKDRFMALLDSFSEATPVLNSVSPKTEAKAGAASRIAEGGLILPTQSTKPNPGQFSSPADYVAAVRAWERK